MVISSPTLFSCSQIIFKVIGNTLESTLQCFEKTLPSWTHAKAAFSSIQVVV